MLPWGGGGGCDRAWAADILPSLILYLLRDECTQHAHGPPRFFLNPQRRSEQVSYSLSQGRSGVSICLKFSSPFNFSLYHISFHL